MRGFSTPVALLRRSCLCGGVLGIVLALGAATAPILDDPIDATTLNRKVICGYQGWFRCPGDSAGEGWRHWSRRHDEISPRTLTFEMWPDMAEYSAEERFPAPGFSNPDGSVATLFSAAHPKTVARHFDWMREYGIDGVFLQRFLVNVGNPPFDAVMSQVRLSAERTGRVYAIGYDMTGMPTERLERALFDDWKRLVDDLNVPQDARYLHHQGKPVVFVWGFFSDRFDAALAHRVIDFFKAEGPYAATLVGGVPWYWRQEKDPEWQRALRRFDVISPWNVGNTMQVAGERQASTLTWKADIEEARRAGMDYLPVIYPGFGWTNLMGPEARSATIPRLGGRFFWKQFGTARALDVDMAYVAMFDEVDEGTAIFKVSNSPPKEGHFETFEGRPADWYLRLTGEGTKVIRGERAFQESPPTSTRP